jgi:hypothetical protein
MGGETIPISGAATANSTRDAHLFDPTPVAGVAAFEALVREMDRRDPSFRT